MAGFKADEAVAKLEWDFRPWVDASGVSPEPSDVALELFQRNYNNNIQAARRTTLSRAALMDQDSGKKTAEEIREELKAWASYNWDEAVDASAELLDGALEKDTARQLHLRLATLISELTGECPATEQIMGLPVRIRSAYIGWFVGQVSNPEGVAVGTSY